MTSAYRQLPSVERLLSDERVARLVEAHSRQVVLDIVRGALEEARGAIAAGGAAPGTEEIIASISGAAEAAGRAWPGV